MTISTFTSVRPSVPPSVRACVRASLRRLAPIPAGDHKMSLIKVVPYVSGTPGVPGAPEPRMYPRSGYFLVYDRTYAHSAEAKGGFIYCKTIARFSFLN